jgi:pilus assembly protein Flp/PilA
MQFIKKLIKNDKGATAIEYGLIAALIAVAAITAMTQLGDQLSDTFTEVKDSMAGSGTTTP